jgi:arylsulfatase
MTAIVRIAVSACVLVGCAGHDSAPLRSGPTSKAPNVILVFADDLSAGELGCYGQQKIRTPRMDELAADGVRLTHFDSAAAVCAPSRAMLLCGLHAGHAPIRDNREVGAEGQAPIGAATETLVTDLRRAGYDTGLFGKWGLGGPGSGSEPLDCGFDSFTGYLCQRKAHDHYPPSLWEGRASLPLRPWADVPGGDATYAHDVIRDAAVRFVGAKRDGPFFMMFATPLPHLALQVPPDDLAEYAGAFPETPYDGKKGYLPHPTPRAAYAAMISRLDRDVGAIVDAVRAAGLERETIILVSADNGATHDVGGVDTSFFESTGGLRGRKGSHFEGGLRVPFIAWGPGRIVPGRVLDAPAWSVDLRATIDAWCGAPAPAGDGRDLSAWLDGRADAPPAPFLGYWESPGYGGQQAVAWQDGTCLWKAFRRGMNAAGADAPVMLFDLSVDPTESSDLAPVRPSVVAAARERMAHEHALHSSFPLPGADPRTTPIDR